MTREFRGIEVRRRLDFPTQSSERILSWRLCGDRETLQGHRETLRPRKEKLSGRPAGVRERRVELRQSTREPASKRAVEILLRGGARECVRLLLNPRKRWSG